MIQTNRDRDTNGQGQKETGIGTQTGENMNRDPNMDTDKFTGKRTKTNSVESGKLKKISDKIEWLAQRPFLNLKISVLLFSLHFKNKKSSHQPTDQRTYQWTTEVVPSSAN